MSQSKEPGYRRFGWLLIEHVTESHRMHDSSNHPQVVLESAQGKIVVASIFSKHEIIASQMR